MNSHFKIQKYNKLRQHAEAYLRDKQEENLPNSTADIIQLFHELKVHQIELELQNQELEESRSQTELALNQYIELYNSAIVGYFTLDRKGTITLTNLMGASFFQLEKSEVIGKFFVDFIKDDKQRSIFKNFLKKVFSTQQKQSCEISLYKDDKKFMVLQIEATSFNNGQECRSVVQDITERIQKEKLARQHQAELTQVMRVNSMGELTSAIAHEINQPLTTIINYVNGCVNHLQSNNYNVSEILNIMLVVSKQAELVGTIIHHMKNLMHQDETFYSLICVNDVAKAATLQIQNEAHYDFSVLLELELAPTLPLVNGDHIQIELVILNLLRNSLEALRKTHIAKPKLILRTERDGDMILVSVINNGPHYSSKEKEHLFDPYFTTKKTGLGMGLSISRTIIEAHFGNLLTYEFPGTGVCFQFSLPIKIEKQGK